MEKLTALGLSTIDAKKIVEKIDFSLNKEQPEQCWKEVLKELNKVSFPIYQLLYETIYPNWNKEPAPCWFPDKDLIHTTNIAKFMSEQGINDYNALHQWSVSDYAEFWKAVIDKLQISFDHPYRSVVDLNEGIEFAKWFPDSTLNIANSCFQAPSQRIAILEQQENGQIRKTTYGELNKLSNRVANSLSRSFNKGDRIAIIMPMSMEAVAIYLGIIKAGCCVVSIPDSFTAKEIATRLRITEPKAVFTQDKIIYDSKEFSLYEKVIDANSPITIVFSSKNTALENRRKQDIHFKEFLINNDKFTSVSCEPDEHINILFSSGTMGEIKAIPWNHTTPIKCASDAFFHHNLQSEDIFCWPANIGWMMGPWLIYACLINQATMAIYHGIPNGRKFGQFIQDNKITVLGVIPTLIRKWRYSGCMEGLDWDSIKLLTSTAECSNIEDMLYLMFLAHNKPIIEYCGGTEIGGAYITGTVIQPSAPAAFTTPALGIDFRILDGFNLSAEKGEVLLVPPSIGMSRELLNKNHHQIYYGNIRSLFPNELLRRHGDSIEHFANGFYRIHGRTDDTMNLNGIKISSVEIEAIVNTHPKIEESAAIAISPSEGGPSQLILYVVPKANESIDGKPLKEDLQKAISLSLNPFFKIHDIVLINYLPRTASNKIMRRTLLDQYNNQKIKKVRHYQQKKRKKICLALQGGGAYGAFCWGILDKLLEDDRIEIDAISATSAGSVNAILLAEGMHKGGNEGAREVLSEFWNTLGHCGEYYSPVRKILPFLGSNLELDFFARSSYLFLDMMSTIYSPYLLNPLNFSFIRQVLLALVEFEHIKINPIKLFLSATNVKTCTLKVFENKDISIDSVLASACLPHISQAVEIDNEYYWDGGYLGNPAIYPLIYNSLVDDILIIHNNPIVRDSIPVNSSDIASRVNEISFNSSLIRELRSIAFITKLIDKGWIKEEYSHNIRRKFLHMIRADETMHQFGLINKYNFQIEFLIRLRDLGRDMALRWLHDHYDSIGKKPTLDFGDFLNEDTQTS